MRAFQRMINDKYAEKQSSCWLESKGFPASKSNAFNRLAVVFSPEALGVEESEYGALRPPFIA
jgi:hypothetical protein